MEWVYLIIAGILEICWVIGMKYSLGFTKLLPSTLTLISMLISVFLLGKAIEKIPIGTAYAIWVGIGTAGTYLCSIILFDEVISIQKLILITLLLISIIGLKLC